MDHMRSIKPFYVFSLLLTVGAWVPNASAQPVTFDTIGSILGCGSAGGCNAFGDNLVFPVSGGGNLVLRHIPVSLTTPDARFPGITTNFGQFSVSCVGCGAGTNSVVNVAGATFVMRVNQTSPVPGGSQFVFGTGDLTGTVTVTAGVATGTVRLVFSTFTSLFGSAPAARYGATQPVGGYLFPVGTTTIAGTLLLEPAVLDGPFQIRYISNPNLGDGVVNITNSGARGAGLAAGTAATTTGAICANVYVFSPDEQMVSCCSCPVTPNGLVSLSARQDLISNTLTPAVPTSIVVKLNASIPIGGSCAGSAANPGNPAMGLAAWGTTVHAGAAATDPSAVTEAPFRPATLNQSEAARLGTLCTFINANGSGFGICRSCRLGGLGAGRI